MNKQHIGSNFFDEIPVDRKQIVVKIGYDDLFRVPVSPYKGSGPFYLEAFVHDRLKEAGIPVSTLGNKVYEGEIEYWEDVDNRQRVYVWKEI